MPAIVIGQTTAMPGPRPPRSGGWQAGWGRSGPQVGRWVRLFQVHLKGPLTAQRVEGVGGRSVSSGLGNHVSGQAIVYCITLRAGKPGSPPGKC